MRNKEDFIAYKEFIRTKKESQFLPSVQEYSKIVEKDFTALIADKPLKIIFKKTYTGGELENLRFIYPLLEQELLALGYSCYYDLDNDSLLITLNLTI